MNIYFFDMQQKCLIGNGIAELDPIDKMPLIPANATMIKPLEVEVNQVAVFDLVTQKWAAKDDIRGIYYDINTKQKVEVTSLDQDITNLTKLEPFEFAKWDINTNVWVLDLDTKAEYDKKKLIAQSESILKENDFRWSNAILWQTEYDDIMRSKVTTYYLALREVARGNSTVIPTLDI
jgi:hypothetical protein